MRRKDSDARDYRTINVHHSTFLRFNAARAQRSIHAGETISVDQFVRELLDKHMDVQAQKPEPQMEIA